MLENSYLDDASDSDDKIVLSIPETLDLFSAYSTWNEPNLSLDESELYF